MRVRKQIEEVEDGRINTAVDGDTFRRANAARAYAGKSWRDVVGEALAAWVESRPDNARTP